MKETKENKGFITIAQGKYYCWLAINLIKSFRLNQKEKYPFAVITDPKSTKKLRKYFDEVIVYPKQENGFLTKFRIQSLSPFAKTIFIDADTLLIKDISCWWDAFEASGYPVGVFGYNSSLEKVPRRPLLSRKAEEKYGFSRYIGFNGGVYYFTDSNDSKKIFERARQALDSYLEDDQILYNGKMGDEPCMEIALLEHDTYSLPSKDRMFCTPGMTKIEIDVIHNLCHCVKYGNDVYPALMHFGTNSTYGLKYRQEVLKLTLYQHHVPYNMVLSIAKCYGIFYKIKHKSLAILKKMPVLRIFSR